MLNSHEKKILGHLYNWTYPEKDAGIKIISLCTETIHGLCHHPGQREKLANLIVFDAHPPLFFDIGRLPLGTSAQQGMDLLYQDLRNMMAKRLDGSRMIFHIQAKDIKWNVNHTQEEIRLEFQIFTNIEDPVPWAGSSSDILEFLQCHQENVLALVQATPSGIHRIADTVTMLIDQGIANLSITIDHHQNWNTADFPIIQTQWERLLDTARAGLVSGRLCIAQCLRIAADGGNDCQAGLRRIFVAPDGVLWPCRQFYSTRNAEAFAIGNLDQGLSEFDNAPFSLFNPDEMQGCDQCDWRDSCDNRCLWSNHRQNGTFYQTSGSVCAYEKVVRNAMKRDSIPTVIQPRLDDYWPLVCFIQ